MARNLLANLFPWDDGTFIVIVNVAILAIAFSFLNTASHILPVVAFLVLAKPPRLNPIFILGFAANNLAVRNQNLKPSHT
jgi:hypothetical protein